MFIIVRCCECKKWLGIKYSGSLFPLFAGFSDTFCEPDLKKERQKYGLDAKHKD